MGVLLSESSDPPEDPSDPSAVAFRLVTSPLAHLVLSSPFEDCRIKFKLSPYFFLQLRRAYFHQFRQGVVTFSIKGVVPITP